MSGSKPGVHDGETMRRSLQEPSAFCDVYSRHCHHIFAYCVAHVGRTRAEDVAQDVFLVAFTHRAAFEFDRDDARPRLCGIARHLCSRHFRSRHPIQLLTRKVPPSTVGASDTAVVERVDALRLRIPLSAAISDLPPSLEETLILHAVNDLAHKEIAALLGIKVGTVKSRLSRAKACIRKCWDSETPEAAPSRSAAMEPKTVHVAMHSEYRERDTWNTEGESL